MWRIMALVCGLTITFGLRADPGERDLQAMQGRWLVDRLEENGVPVPAEELKKFAITIKGTQIVVTIDRHDETMDF
jgi:uncharacterized protein (TIGR03067 family)